MNRNEFVLKTKQILINRLDTLRRRMNSELELHGRSESVMDAGDDALDAESDDMFRQIAQCESRELEAIEYAIDRIRQGVYGVCDTCGRDIPMQRLRALPYASQCIGCKRQQEHQPHRFLTQLPY